MKRDRRDIARAILLAAGMIAGGGACAEPLAGLGVQYQFVSALNFTTYLRACSQPGNPMDEIATANCGGQVSGSIPYKASVDLPEGALVQHVYVWYYDYSTTGSFRASFVRTSMGLAPTIPYAFTSYIPDNMSFDSGVAAADQNWHVADLVPAVPVVINSWGIGDGTTPIYIANRIEVDLKADDLNIKFNGALIAYQRQIAPAPKTASFSDVSTNYPFFNEIEQLKKSGITLGCGNGQFCPDAPVTRGQMAAFLSRALGLQWSPPV